MTNGRLRDTVAIVTGAGSGIGRATAVLFARQGARVAVVDVNGEAGRDTVRQMDLPSVRAISVTADVSDSTQVEAAVKAVVSAFDAVDILVNVVGVSGRRWGDGPVHECTDEAWERLMAVNLRSVFLCCRSVIPLMLDRGGSIVNVSSVLGLVGGDEDFATHAYAATRGGVISLTRSIASYYAAQRIRANVICPSLVATAMSRRAQESDHIRSRLSELQPLTGDFGEPEDVAHAALYLASGEAKFVTGAVLTVDGGWTVR
jgi:NAD(P)-dependent dehydrogenase (short-subunit alcohol dehydrogenase family)